MKEKVFFAHGNGFPSLCYQQLFNNLEARYECSYVDRIGHHPDFPVTENWDKLVDELRFHIKDRFSEPITGIGHSLGGVLTFLAAIREPSLFKAVVMIDSPLFGRFKSRMLQFAKSMGLIDRVTPASRAKSRRQHWKSREELTEYLKARPLFSTFSDACLQDYINFGFIKNQDGYQLYFDSYVEYLIFRTIPHHLAQFEGPVPVPTALIYGDKSTVVDRFDIGNMEKKYQIKCYSMPGTHMLPMENPAGLGLKIFKAIDELNG